MNKARSEELLELLCRTLPYLEGNVIMCRLNELPDETPTRLLREVRQFLAEEGSLPSSHR